VSSPGSNVGETLPLPEPTAPFKLTPRIVLLTASLILATVMQSLDGTIANVALPHMQGSMSAAQDQITWVLTSYVVTAAICTPLTGFLVNRYGRRSLALISIISFTVASMLCGAAQTLAQIVMFRILQGAAGSLLMPLSQAVIMDIYPREKHAPALAVWSMGVIMAPILGPTIGGYLTETYSWRWVFYVNLPVGVLSIIGIVMFLSESKRDTSIRFDLFGFVMLGSALGALQMMLDRVVRPSRTRTTSWVCASGSSWSLWSSAPAPYCRRCYRTCWAIRCSRPAG